MTVPEANSIADRARSLLSDNPVLYPGDLRYGRIVFCSLVSLDAYSDTNVTSFVPLVGVVDQLLSANHSVNWRQLDVDEITTLLVCTDNLSKMAVQSMPAVGRVGTILDGDNINMSLVVGKGLTSNVSVSHDGNAVDIPHDVTDGESMM